MKTKTANNPFQIKIFDNKESGAKKMANIIADTIKSRNSKREKTVLGLATGSSPIMIYQELINLHKEEGLSFQNVITFNLDEYWPMSPDHVQSYHRFMYKHLFNHIDINPQNIHIPDGTLENPEIDKFCTTYEEKIKTSGGIDIQILGIGRSGHIGFNEPGSKIDSVTRKVDLHPLTIEDAAGDFGGENAVPRQAITMGIDTILNARKILFAAWGKSKAPILEKMVNGPVSCEIPASFLQHHPDVSIFADKEAAAEIN
ncbi:MAG: glucosamine-6-phosphate deaminase [Bacteroidota bacterium]